MSSGSLGDDEELDSGDANGNAENQGAHEEAAGCSSADANRYDVQQRLFNKLEAAIQIQV